MVAIVEGDVDAQLSCGIEQAFLFGVFFDGVDESSFGDAFDRVGPCLAAVAGAIDVGMVVGDEIWGTVG